MGDELKNFILIIESYFFYAVVLLMPLFAIISLINRFRINQVRLSLWHGLLFGFPLLPTIYAFVQVLCIGIGLMIGDDESVMKFVLYLIASFFWFVGSAASEQRVLTENGIVVNIHSKKSLLSWSEVNDYFSKQRRFYTEYHFFHGKPTPIKGAPSRWNVVILRVQQRQVPMFESLLKEKLDHRFDIDPVKIYRNEFKP